MYKLKFKDKKVFNQYSYFLQCSQHKNAEQYQNIFQNVPERQRES